MVKIECQNPEEDKVQEEAKTAIKIINSYPDLIPVYSKCDGPIISAYTKTTVNGEELADKQLFTLYLYENSLRNDPKFADLYENRVIVYDPNSFLRALEFCEKCEQAGLEELVLKEHHTIPTKK